MGGIVNSFTPIGYLMILIGSCTVGLALLVGALLLYRTRHLERAGDFIAFKPMKPMFLAVYALCVGCVLFYLAYEISGTGTGYFFFAIGLLLGYFTGKMLLERSLADMQGNTVKLQLVGAAPDGLNILHESSSGRLKTLVVRGSAMEIATKAEAAKPAYFDVLPLSLEEIFIYELGGVNYEVKNILL